MQKKRLAVMLILLFASNAHSEINRVYHPYVEQHEREIEYGFVLRDAGNTNLLLNRAGVGYAWTDKFFSEIYVLTESITHDNEQVRSYEAEFKWQLTEQGEYWADWGLLVEIGKAKDIDSNEVAIGLLYEKELTSRWVAAANILVEYESGGDIDDELESAFRGQLRYRYNPRFSIGIEAYADDQDIAFGPLMMGNLALLGKKRVNWELGMVFGLDSNTPNTSIRGGLEVEF